MIKNMLKRGKESDTYLATDSRPRRSLQIAMKVEKVCSFQPVLRPSSADLPHSLGVSVFDRGNYSLWYDFHLTWSM